MSSPRVQANPQSSLPFGEEAKPGFRTKTAATRLTPEVLGEIEAAAESAGQALSEWLRGIALSAARHRKADKCRLIPSSKFTTRQTHESFSRRTNCLMSSSPASPSKRVARHEFHTLAPKLFAPDGSAMGRSNLLFATGRAERIAEPVFK